MADTLQALAGPNGGDYRKWFGNITDVVNWENQGHEIRTLRNDRGKFRARVQNEKYYFKEGLTWSALTSGAISVRTNPVGTMCAGAGYFINAGKDGPFILGFLNSSTCARLKKILNESMNNEVGNLSQLPVLKGLTGEVEHLVLLCTNICRTDWDSSEMSFSFERHPFI